MFTFIQDTLVGVLRHLLRQTVEQNVGRLVATAATGWIAKQLIQGGGLALLRV